MGGWQLEVARMAGYIFFPVVFFYSYHQIGFKEEFVTELHKKHLSARMIQDRERKAETEKIIREFRQRKLQEELEEQERAARQ